MIIKNNKNKKERYIGGRTKFLFEVVFRNSGKLIILVLSPRQARWQKGEQEVIIQDASYSIRGCVIYFIDIVYTQSV